MSRWAEISNRVNKKSRWEEIGQRVNWAESTFEYDEKPATTYGTSEETRQQIGNIQNKRNSLLQARRENSGRNSRQVSEATKELRAFNKKSAAKELRAFNKESATKELRAFNKESAAKIELLAKEYNELKNYEDEQKIRNLSSALIKRLDEYNAGNKDVGRGGLSKDEFKELAKARERTSNKLNTEKEIQEAMAYAKNNPAMASIKSVGDKLTSGVMSGFDRIGQAFVDPYRDVDTNTRSHAGSHRANASRQVVSEQIDNDALRFLYNTGMSGADSLGAMAARLIPVVGQALTLGTMGASAMADTAIDLNERGASAQQVQFGSLAAGVFEGLFERFSLGNLSSLATKNTASLKGMAKELVKSMGVNASEEMATEMANIAYDTIAHGEISNVQLQYDELVKNGVPPTEARKQIAKDLALQVMESGAAGALMGGAFGTGAMTTGNIRYARSAKKMSDEVKSDVVKYAQNQEGEAGRLYRESIGKDGMKNAGLGMTAEAVQSDIVNKIFAAKDMNSLVEAYDSVVKEAESSEVRNLADRAYRTQVGRIKAGGGIAQMSEESLAQADEKSNIDQVVDREEKGFKDEIRASVPALTKAGKTVEITGVKDNKYVTANGEAVEYDDITFDNQTNKVLMQSAANYDGEVQQDFIANYKGGPVADYQASFNALMQYGKLGRNITLDQALEDNRARIELGYISREGAIAAYKAGRATVKDSVQKKAKTVKREKGYYVENGAKASEGMRELLKAFAEKTGVATEYTDFIDADGQSANGQFISAVAKIAIAAESVNELETLGHEGSHFAKAYASEEYQKMEDAIIRYIAQSTGAKNTESYIESEMKHRKMSREDLIEEMVSDFMGGICGTEEGARAFVEYLMNDKSTTVQEKKSILQSVIDIIDKILSELKAMINGEHLSSVAKFAAEEQYEDIKHVQELFFAALDEASKNLKSGRADSNLATEADRGSEEVKFSLKNKNITKDTKIPYVENQNYINVPKNDNVTLEKLRDEVRNLKRGTYENKATGYKADIKRETIGKIITPKPGKFNPWVGNYIENLNAAVKLPELFEKAVYIDSKPPQKAKNVGKQIKDYHHFVAPIRMDGKDYRVMITAREKQNSDTLYIVKTELMQIKRGSQTGGQKPTVSFGNPLEISIPDLVNGVNIYDYGTQQNVTYSDADIKYSVSRRIETEEDVDKYLNTATDNTSKKKTIKAWKNGEKVVLKSDEEIKGFIVDSVNKMGGKKQAAYGQVNDRLAKAVAEEDPGIDIRDYYLELNPSDLEHTFKHSEVDEEYPNNIPLTMEDMENLPNYIDNFTDVLETVNKENEKNKVKKVRIGTRVNGYTIITTIVSDGRNSVRPKTMYKISTDDYLRIYGDKIKKKKANVDAQTQRFENDPNGSPSIVSSSSNKNIPYNDKGVKYSVSDNKGRKLINEPQTESADGEVKNSIKGEKTQFAKTRATTKPTEAPIQKMFASIREVRNKTMKENGFADDEIEATNMFFDQLMDFMEEAEIKYEAIGLKDINNAELQVRYDRKGNVKSVIMSAMVKNGEYPINFDFSSICKKRQSLAMVIEELSKRKDGSGKRYTDTFKLTADKLMAINEALRGEGLETACLGCFVEAKRFNVQNFADKACEMWNSIVDEVRAEQGKKGKPDSFNFAEGVDTDSIDFDEVDAVFSKYEEEKERTSPAKRMRALIKNGGETYQKYLSPSDLMTPQGIQAIKTMSTRKNNFYGILKGVYGQAAPKEVMAFSPYNSEIALLPKTKSVNRRSMSMAKYLTKIGGIRAQSFSDFLIANIYDYMQLIADASARRFPMHMYTKEIACAKLLGMTGAKINLSVMFDIDANLPDEYAGLTFVEDSKGDASYNGKVGRWEYLVGDKARADREEALGRERPFVQSIGFDEAVELQNDPNYSNNVGIIGVGYSRNHILKMLDDVNIKYIIPYHSSSLPATIKAKTRIDKATDYTPFQNTRKIVSVTDSNGNPVKLNLDGPNLGDGFADLYEKIDSGEYVVKTEAMASLGSFDIYEDVARTNNPKETANNYLEYCAENNCLPVFEEFADHENYYKFLFDFSVYNHKGEYAPQVAVQNIYPGYNYAEGITSTDTIKAMVEEEMSAQNAINLERNAKMPRVVDNAIQILSKDDVKNSLFNEEKFDINEAVADHYGIERKKTKLGESVKYSVDNEVSKLIKQNEKLEAINKNLKQQMKLTKGVRLDDRVIGKLARRIARQYGSSYDGLQEELTQLYNYVASGDITFEELQSVSSGIARNVLDNIRQKNVLTDDARTILNDIKAVKITLNETQKQEAAYMSDSYNNYRKSLFGRVNIGNDGVSLDTQWQEWAEQYPNLFDASLSDAEQVIALKDIVNVLSNSYVDEYGFDIDEASEVLGYELLNEYFSIPEVRTFADKQKAKYDKLKLESAQKLREYKKESRDKYEDKLREVKAELRDVKRQASRDRKQYSEDIVRAIAKTRTYEREKFATREGKAKYRRRIEKTVKKINRLFMKNEDLKNVPDRMKVLVSQFMQEFTNDTSVFNGAKLGDLANFYKRIETNENYVNLAAAYDEDVAQMLDDLRETIDGKRLSKLTVEELSMVSDIMSNLYHMIRSENEVIIGGRRESLREVGEKACAENTRANAQKRMAFTGSEWFKTCKRFFGDGNISPQYFFGRMGGVMNDLYEDFLNAQDNWAIRMQTSQDKFAEIAERNHYYDWDLNEKIAITTEDGEVELTPGQLMLVYATGKREQLSGQDSMHIFEGGLTLRDYVSKETRTIGSKAVKLNVVDPNKTFRFTFDQYVEACAKLTAEQLSMADELVAYLSTDLAKWGNEASLEMYGITKFNESYYIPFNSDPNFIYSQQGGIVNQMNKFKSASFTKKTVKGAKNPLILDDIVDVWTSHVGQMVSYSTMVIPLDNMNKVFNYKKQDDEGKISLKEVIANTYTQDATRYIDQFMTDVNGGVATSPVDQFVKKYVSLFKKGATYASLSVVVQQPTSVARAMLYINPKYFIGTDKIDYEQLKKYAPIAIVKSMGRFDTMTGMSSKEWLTKRKYASKADALKNIAKDKNVVEDAFGYGAVKGDELGWGILWNACKREVADKQGLSGDELLIEAGKRFRYVANQTQVYDSVLAKSQNMRSNTAVSSMVMSFMAEPTVGLNMMMDGIIKARKGDYKFLARATGAFMASGVLAAFMKAFVSAARDDDEDKTYIEKWLGKFAGGTWDNINPVNMIPIARDVYSMYEGYSVERTDLAVISDLMTAIKGLESTSKTPREKIVNLAGAVGNMFGIPARNIYRDVTAAVRMFGNMTSDKETTAYGIGKSVREELNIDKSKTDYAKDLLKVWNKDVSKQAKVIGTLQKEYDMAVRSGADADTTRSNYKRVITTQLKPVYMELSTSEKIKFKQMLFRIRLGGVSLYDNEYLNRYWVD